MSGFDGTLRRIQALHSQPTSAEDIYGVAPRTCGTNLSACGARMVVVDGLAGERGGRSCFLALQDVDYIDADGHCMALHVGNRLYTGRDSLKRLFRALEPYGFVRISSSRIVNVQRVHYAEKGRRGVPAFVLLDGTRLVFGPGYYIAAGAELRVKKRRRARKLLE